MIKHIWKSLFYIYYKHEPLCYSDDFMNILDYDLIKHNKGLYIMFYLSLITSHVPCEIESRYIEIPVTNSCLKIPSSLIYALNFIWVKITYIHISDMLGKPSLSILVPPRILRKLVCFLVISLPNYQRLLYILFYYSSHLRIDYFALQ